MPTGASFRGFKRVVLGPAVLRSAHCLVLGPGKPRTAQQPDHPKPEKADLVEDALLLTWIDQLAAYVRSQDMWHEAATVRDINVSKLGFLDPTRLNSKKHQYGCFAIYSHIEDKGEGIVLGELTAVSQRATKFFAAKQGMFFTEAIASLYPPGATTQVSRLIA
ncbi:hypothetical protein PG984_011980 [Apiospora sp. TS-2023a]